MRIGVAEPELEVRRDHAEAHDDHVFVPGVAGGSLNEDDSDVKAHTEAGSGAPTPPGSPSRAGAPPCRA